MPFALATRLPDVQVLDETQWQQQREAMLACIAAEDRRRAEAAQQAQQVIAENSNLEVLGSAAN